MIFFYLAINMCERDMIYLRVLDGDLWGGGGGCLPREGWGLLVSIQM